MLILSMDIFSIEERKFVVKCYHRDQSNRQIMHSFQTQFEKTIAYETVRNIINNFEMHGCLYPKKHRNEATQNEERDVLICAAVEREPQLSSRTLADQLHIAHSTVRKVLRKNKYRSYKLKKSNEIFPNDKYERFDFCEALLERCNNNENFVNHILFTDESSFPIHGKHNPSVARYWSQINRYMIYDARTQYPQKLNVWAGLLGDHIIGPFLIVGNLNSQKYLALLQNSVIPCVQNIQGINLNDIWFQHDGCPAHNAAPVREYLTNIFNNKLITGWSAIRWPARSPDLSPNDFFLWGYVKSSVYGFQHDRAQTTDELRIKINHCMRNISPQTMTNVRREFVDRLGYCAFQLGDRFEHLVH